MKLYKEYNINEDLYEFTKKLEPLQIAFHSDADGIGSAALLASMFNIQKDNTFPYSPSVFGGYKDGNVAVDLGTPLLKDFYLLPDGSSKKCLVIDHHGHPDNPTYPLLTGEVPTGLLVYEAFKDKIPKNKLFLVVLSLVGDGQPELIPDEIWDQLPELWHSQGKIYKNKYGGAKAYPYPLFLKIASPINALCRIGAVGKALELAIRATSIREIVFNPTANLAQKDISSEESRLYADYNNPISIEKIGNFGIVTYKSKYNLAGRIGATLTKSDSNLTYIVVNETTRDISVRGVMALYLTNKLMEKGYLAGGHAGFAGVTMLSSNTIEGLIHDIRDILTK